MLRIHSTRSCFHSGGQKVGDWSTTKQIANLTIVHSLQPCPLLMKVGLRAPKLNGGSPDTCPGVPVELRSSSGKHTCLMTLALTPAKLNGLSPHKSSPYHQVNAVSLAWPRLAPRSSAARGRLKTTRSPCWRRLCLWPRSVPQGPRRPLLLLLQQTVGTLPRPGHPSPSRRSTPSAPLALSASQPGSTQSLASSTYCPHLPWQSCCALIS